MSTGGEAWDRRFSEHEWSQDPDPFLIELVQGLPPGGALDLGCGPGRNAIWLARQGFQVTGVDSSSVGLQQAQARAGQAGVTLCLVAADLMEYQAEDASFDLVVVANIHPGPELLPEILAKAARALRRDGHLFVVGHHLDALGHDGPPQEELLYTEERLLTAVPPSLTIERLETVPRGGPDRSEHWHDKSVILWALRRPDPALP